MGEAGRGFCIMRHMALPPGVTPFRSTVLALARAVPPVAVLASVALAACSPELNWRTVQPEQADGLSALFPCKPDRIERRVPWPGMQGGVAMRLLSCEAQGRNWALGYATMPDVTAVAPALRHWPALTRANFQRALASPDGLRERDLGPVTVPRMTPSDLAHARAFEGMRAGEDGKPEAVALRTWHFFHGMTVFQASVSGAPGTADPQSGEDVAQAFFRSFHFAD